MQSIILASNRLTGTIPPSFRLLPLLQRLDLSDNNFNSDLETFLLPVTLFRLLSFVYFFSSVCVL